jgi:FkbM family methyltransferase
MSFSVVVKHSTFVLMFVGGIIVGSFFNSPVLHYHLSSRGSNQRQLIDDTAASYPHYFRARSSNNDIMNKDGWQTVQVFYGSSDHVESLLPHQDQQKLFSQARQDEVILKLLRNKTMGFFVDLAANDATVLSNTYALERHYGWKGLCIEPNPAYWYNLTHYRNRCQIVGAVMGERRMEQVHFKYVDKEHGGIVGTGFDNGPRHQKWSLKEYTVTLKEVFERTNPPAVIDYLSLDVEGAEYFIMKDFPFDLYTFRCMTIERPKDALKALLEQHGYKNILRLSKFGETLWIHSSFEKEMDLTGLEQFHAKQQWKEAKARMEADKAVTEETTKTA